MCLRNPQWINDHQLSKLLLLLCQFNNMVQYGGGGGGRGRGYRSRPSRARMVIFGKCGPKCGPECVFHPVFEPLLPTWSNFFLTVHEIETKRFFFFDQNTNFPFFVSVLHSSSLLCESIDNSLNLRIVYSQRTQKCSAYKGGRLRRGHLGNVGIVQPWVVPEPKCTSVRFCEEIPRFSWVPE